MPLFGSDTKERQKEDVELEEEDVIIISEGVSCRQQIQQGTRKDSRHLVEVLAEYL